MSDLAERASGISVEEYHRLGERGAFAPEVRLELLEGKIIVMSPIGYRHAWAVRQINNLFGRLFGAKAIVDAQNALTISGQSEPQPDVLLLRKEVMQRRTLPIPEDVLLLIEVSDSTLTFDRKDKRAVYAKAGIADFWILDLTRNELQVLRKPKGKIYQWAHKLGAEASIAPLAFPKVAVKVGDLLPP